MSDAGTSTSPIDGVRAEAAEAGFNLTGVVGADAFDAVAPRGHGLRTVLDDPEIRSVLVVGSGGCTFWEVFKGRQTGARPRELDAAKGSIDRYSRLVMERLARHLRTAGLHARAVFPFELPGRSLSFRRLAQYAGLGTPDTVLTTLIHPEYGPWVSLRGAIVMHRGLPAAGPPEGFGPCRGCARPCVEACPIGTFTGSTWDHGACVRYRVLEEGCPTACLSRRTCVVGVDHQYSDEEYGYRHPFSPQSLARLRRELDPERS